MKKGKISIIFLSIIALIFLCIASCAILSPINSAAIADEDDTVRDFSQNSFPIYSSMELYFILEQPEYIAVSDSLIVVYDNGKLRTAGIHSSVISLASIMPNIQKIMEIKIYEHYIFFTYLDINDKSQLVIYNVSSTSTQTASMTTNSHNLLINGNYPDSVAIDSENDYLYTLYNSKVYRFKLSIEGNKLDISVEGSGILDTVYEKSSTLSYMDRKINYSNGNLYILNLDSNNFKFKIIEFNIESNLTLPLNSRVFSLLYTFNVINSSTIYYDIYKEYILLSGGSDIYLYPIDTDEDIIVLSEYEYNGIATADTGFYLTDKNNSLIKHYELETDELNSNSLVYDYEYGYYGNKDYFLNAPEAVAVYENYTYILDTGASRIVRYTNNGYYVTALKVKNIDSLLTHPSSITIDKNGNIYVSGNTDTIYYFDNELNNTGSIKLDDKVIKSINIDREGSLYALTSSGLFKKRVGGEWDLSLDIANISHFCVSFAGNTLYTIQGSSLRFYTKDGQPFAYSINLNDHLVTNPVDMVSDYKGNVYILYYDTNKLKIAKFTRLVNGYEFTLRLEVKIDNAQIDHSDVRAFNIDSIGNVLLVNNKYNILEYLHSDTHLIVAVEGNTDFQDPTQMTATQVVSTIKECYLYRKPNNYEDIISVDKDTLMTVLNNTVMFGGKLYYYINYNGIYYYVEGENVAIVENSAPPYTKGVIRHSELKIYGKPIEDDKYINKTLNDKSLIIDVSFRVGYVSDDIDLGFYMVSYAETTGYVKAERLSIYSNPEYNTTEPNYMKVRTEGLGKRVPLYRTASIMGGVLCTIGDGERIILLEEYSADKPFILVNYDGIEGYIDSSLLYSSGLSYVQKIILFAVIAVVICMIALVIIKIARRIKNKGSV